MAGPLTQVLATSDGKTDRRRIRIGDIVEIATPKGFAYAQYTHEHPQYGSLIRVLPGLHAERRPDLSRLAQGRHLWVVFFPVRVGVRRGMIELAAHADVPPEAAAFSLFKVAGLDDPKTGRVLNWGLWDGQRESFPVELSSEQWELPTLEIVNLEALVHMIVTGWRPEHDALRARTGARQAPEARPEPGSQTVSAAGASPARHFLVLPSAAAARHRCQS